MIFVNLVIWKTLRIHLPFSSI